MRFRDALKGMNGLSSIQLRAAGLTSNHAADLAKGLMQTPNLTYLSISGNPDLRTSGLSILSMSLQNLTRLRYLSLDCVGLCAKAGKILSQVILKMPLLITLSLSDNLLCDVSVSHIAVSLMCLHQLQELILESVVISDVGLNAIVMSLRNVLTVESINVSNNRDITVDAVKKAYSDFATNADLRQHQLIIISDHEDVDPPCRYKQQDE